MTQQVRSNGKESIVVVNGTKYILPPGGNVSVIGTNVYYNGELITKDNNQYQVKKMTLWERIVDWFDDVVDDFDDWIE